MHDLGSCFVWTGIVVLHILITVIQSMAVIQLCIPRREHGVFKSIVHVYCLVHCVLIDSNSCTSPDPSFLPILRFLGGGLVPTLLTSTPLVFSSLVVFFLFTGDSIVEPLYWWVDRNYTIYSWYSSVHKTNNSQKSTDILM